MKAEAFIEKALELKQILGTMSPEEALNVLSKLKDDWLLQADPFRPMQERSYEEYEGYVID
ncbi:MAG TPA: hypothetical protein VGE24_11185 [Emticicia sp.]